MSRKLIIISIAIFIVAACFVACNSDVDKQTVSVQFAPSTKKAINQAGSAQSTTEENVNLYHWEYTYVSGDEALDLSSNSLTWYEFFSDKTKTGLGEIKNLVKGSDYTFGLRGYTTDSNTLTWEGKSAKTKLDSMKKVVTVDVYSQGKGSIYFDIWAPVHTTAIHTSGTNYYAENNDRFRISYSKFGQTTPTNTKFVDTVLNDDGDEFHYKSVGGEPMILDNGSYLFTIQQYEYDVASDNADKYDPIKTRTQVLIVNCIAGMDTVISGSLDSTALLTFDYEGGASGKEYGIEVEFIEGITDEIKTLGVKIKKDSGEEKVVRQFDTVYVRDKQHVIIDFSDATEDVTIYVNGDKVFTTDSNLVEDENFGPGFEFYYKDYDKTNEEAYKASFLNTYKEDKTIKAYARKGFTYLVTITSGKLSKTFSITGIDDNELNAIATKTFSESDLSILPNKKHKLITDSKVLDIDAYIKESTALELLNKHLADHKVADANNNTITLTLHANQIGDNMSTLSFKFNLQLDYIVTSYNSDSSVNYTSETQEITEPISDFMEIYVKDFPAGTLDMKVKNNSILMSTSSNFNSVTTASDLSGAGYYSYDEDEDVLTLKVNTFSSIEASYRQAEQFTLSYYDEDLSLLKTCPINENELIDFWVHTKNDKTAAWMVGPENNAVEWKFDTDRVTSDVNLYAKYSAEKLTFSYENNNSNMVPVSVNRGTCLKDVEGDPLDSGFPNRSSYLKLEWYFDQDFTSPCDITTNKITTNGIKLYHKTVGYDYVRSEGIKPDLFGFTKQLTVNIKGINYNGRYEWPIAFAPVNNLKGTSQNSVIIDGVYYSEHANGIFCLTTGRNQVIVDSFKATLLDDPDNNEWGYKLLRVQGSVGYIGSTSDPYKEITEDYLIVTPKPLKAVRIYKNFSQWNSSGKPWPLDQINTKFENKEQITALVEVGDTFPDKEYQQGKTQIYLEPVYDCKVTYVTNGGTTLPVKTIESHSRISTPTDCTKKLCQIEGWYTDPECTKRYDFNTYLWDDITIYAKWETAIKGTASVSGSTGRTSSGWVQLWEDGPKFAEFNIGSTITTYTDITERNTASTGGYYQYGATVDLDSSNEAGVTYSTSTNIKGSGIPGIDTLGDTATLLWGYNWQTPTKEETTKLKDSNYTTREWMDGTNKQYVPGCTLQGVKISGIGDYSNNSIFFPTTGFWRNGIFINTSDILYWTSTPYTEELAPGEDISQAYDFMLSSGNNNMGYSPAQNIVEAPVRAVLIEPIKVESISLNKTSTALYVGSTETLTSTLLPDNATYKSVIWTSSNSSVATVDSNGKISAIKIGTATITAKSAFDQTKTASCSITVKPVVYGIAAVSGNTGRTSCDWVQLWENGPKFAKYNVGTTINTYQNLNSYSVANNGGHYEWGGTIEKESATTYGTNHSTSTNSIQGTGIVGIDTVGDTATLLWGYNWQTPSKDNYTDLVSKCNWIWCNGKTTKYKDSSIAGYYISGKSPYDEANMFLPVGGYLFEGSDPSSYASQSTAAYYWTSSYNPYGRTAFYISSSDKYISDSLNSSLYQYLLVRAIYVEPVDVSSVSLNKSSTTITLGSSETLIATVSPNDATEKSVTWSSSDSSVASVNNGVVKALKNGTATITATSNFDSSKKDSCKVTVSGIAVSSISLNMSTTTTDIGSSFTLTATVLPNNASDKTYTWSSSDTSIATVSNGVVTPIKGGTVTITATANSDSTKKDTCTVNVNFFGRGKGVVLASAGMTNNECEWVQLWEGGPKWATMNVGATKSNYLNAGDNYDDTNYIGGFYQWGGTINKASNNYSSSKTSIQGTGIVGTDTTGDTATLVWGTKWQMPSDTQLQGLIDNCTWVWHNYQNYYTTGCNLYGYEIRGKGAYSDNSIFIPAAGSYSGDAHWYGSNIFAIWSSEYFFNETFFVEGGKTLLGASDLKSVDASSVLTDKNNVRAIYVGDIPATGLSIITSTSSTDVGSSLTLTASIQPANATERLITWSSSDTSIATVNNGVVSGLKAGTVTITASLTSNTNISATCSVVFIGTKGTAAVSGSTGRTSCGWVQLWKNGPRFAEFNVGSTINSYASVTQYTTANIGGYYEWGGTTDHETRKDSSGTTFSGSTTDIAGTGTASGSVGSLGDTAKILWGSNWKMPTESQFESLLENCNWNWCDGSTKQYQTGCTLIGYKVTGEGDYSDNSIFLPASGYDASNNNSPRDVGALGQFWSSTPDGGETAYILYLSAPGTEYSKIIGSEFCTCGFSVRAILAE